jgi:hypothetical protein
MTVLGEESEPDLDVAVLDGRQLAVDVGSSRVLLGIGEGAVEEGRVGFITEVVEPCGGGGHDSK